jgi:hypothetical protein
MRGTVRSGALVAALLAALACRPPRTPPPDLSLDPAALHDQVIRAQGKVRSVSGDAKVAVDGPGGAGTVSQFVAAELPDRLHLEVLDFFGNVAMVLAAGDGRFALYDAREKVFYRGEATPANLSRLLPLPMAAEDLVAILCGRPPRLDGVPTAATAGPGYVTLELTRGRESESLRVGAGGVVERATRRLEGPGSYEVRFDAYQQRGGVPYPREIALRASDPKVKVDLRWKQVELNGEVAPALFRLDPPRGARVVELRGDAPGSPPSPFLPAPGDPAGSAAGTPPAPAGAGPSGRE